MSTHLIPRANVKGQDRFFIIFTVPGLIGTLIGVGIGFLFYSVLDMLGLKAFGLIVMAVFGLIGFAVGQVKIPDTNATPLFRLVGGEYIKTIIKRYMAFQKSKKKYVNEISTKQTFTVKENKVEKVIMNKE